MGWHPTTLNSSGQSVTPKAAARDTGLCDTPPLYGDLGVAGASLLAPGDATRSLVALRMRANDNNRMPPLGSDVVDETAASMIDEWISALPDCM